MLDMRSPGLPTAVVGPIQQKTCPFCNRSFGRLDGVRRHTKTCPARGARPVPPASKRGRKSTACSECSRLKVLCHGAVPCQRCSSRNLVCSFERVCTDLTHVKALSQAGSQPHLNERYARLKFLLYCTDPKVNLVGDALAYGEPKDEITPSSDHAPVFDGLTWQDTLDPPLLFLGLMDPYFDMSLDMGGIYGIDYAPDMAPSLPTIIAGSLQNQVDCLRADIEQLMNARPDIEIHNHQDQLNTFFTCVNFERLIAVFFGKRQLLARMIHWPTFDPCLVDLGLLLAIVLSGTTYSQKSPESSSYASLMDVLHILAAKYVFRRLKQCDGRDGSRSELEMCQAAYLITVLQFGVHDVDIRRKAITKRQPALVNVLRRLGMLKSKHIKLPAENDWQAFVYRESCIRLATFVIFNDALLALFCNTPPNTTVADTVGDLPCTDDLWEADCPAAFMNCLEKGALISQFPCMKEILSCLLLDEWDEAGSAAHHNLGASGLYAVIGAFQLILYNHRANAPLATRSDVLLRALDRWEQLWYDTVNKLSADQQKWLGVARYSPEFALISRRIVEFGTTDAAKSSRYMQQMSQYDFELFHEFILQHGLTDIYIPPLLRQRPHLPEPPQPLHLNDEPPAPLQSPQDNKLSSQTAAPNPGPPDTILKPPPATACTRTSRLAFSTAWSTSAPSSARWTWETRASRP